MRRSQRVEPIPGCVFTQRGESSVPFATSQRADFQNWGVHWQTKNMYLPPPALLLQCVNSSCLCLIHWAATPTHQADHCHLVSQLLFSSNQAGISFCFFSIHSSPYFFCTYSRHSSALLQTDFMVVMRLSVLTVSSYLSPTKCYFLLPPITSFAFALPGHHLPVAVWCFEKQRGLMSPTGVYFGCPHLTVCLFFPALSAPLPADLLRSRCFLVQEIRLPLNGPVAFPKSHTCNCWHFPLATLNCSLAQLLLSLPPALWAAASQGELPNPLYSTVLQSNHVTWARRKWYVNKRSIPPEQRPENAYLNCRQNIKIDWTLVATLPGPCRCSVPRQFFFQWDSLYKHETLLKDQSAAQD